MVPGDTGEEHKGDQEKGEFQMIKADVKTEMKADVIKTEKTEIKRDKMKYEIKPEAMTERYKCRKCGSRKCSYYELQTRSADEPMTQFFTCLDCKNRWKM